MASPGTGMMKEGGWCATPNVCKSRMRSLTSSRAATRGSMPTAEALPDR
jgi:hypothetical protein